MPAFADWIEEKEPAKETRKEQPARSFWDSCQREGMSRREWSAVPDIG